MSRQGIWFDPVADRIQKRNIKGDQRHVRTVLEDIEILALEKGQTFQDLSKCQFKPPISFEDAKLYTQELRIVSHVLKYCENELSAAHSTLSEPAMAVIQDTRNRLLNSVSMHCALLEVKHKFTYKWIDLSLRLEPMIFYAILQCCQMVNYDRKTYSRLAQFSPKSEVFSGLAEQSLFHPSFSTEPFFQYSVAELLFLLQFIESRWNYIEFVSDQLLYLFEILMARLAIIATSVQPVSLFEGTEKYRKMVSPEFAVVTTTFLEDFFWAIVPMYYKTLLRTQFEQYKAPLPYTITDAEVIELKKFLSNLTKANRTVSLQAGFQTAYMECCLRPSEFKRYMRDNPGADQLRSSIVSTQRNIEVRNSIMEKLASMPWEICEQEELEPHELDMLYLMMLDVKINNTSRETGFSWIQDTVYFRIHMIEDEDPLGKVRTLGQPIIVQSFNSYGLFYKDCFYDYRCAMRSFLHWLIIVITEFNGLVSRTSMNSLHTLIPSALKAQTIINF